MILNYLILEMISCLLLLAATVIAKGITGPNGFYIDVNGTKEEQRERLVQKYLEAGDLYQARSTNCSYGTIADMDGEQFWIDNQWQKMGARRLSQADYEKYVYGGKSSKPWLLWIGRTPYGTPDGDFHSGLILLKRCVCMLEAFENQINVGIIDTHLEEYVKHAFDPDVSRLGPGAAFVVFVKDGVAHMMP